MAPGSPAPRAHVDVTTWSDASSRDALGLLASAVAEMAGFATAVVSVVRDDDTMFGVCVEGEQAMRDSMLGMVTPLGVIRADLAAAEDWGRFRFVPHDRVDGEDGYTWVPEMVPLEGPDAWHPLDLLLAPLHDQDGAMIGLLSVDLPLSGRLPGPAQRLLLERYAAQIERALRMGVERAELAARVRLLETARQVVRLATAQPDLDRALEDCRRPVMEGYAADFLAIRTYPGHDFPEGGAPLRSLGGAAAAAVRQAVRRSWALQRVGLVSQTMLDPDVLSSEQHRVVVDHLADLDIGVAMLVPFGTGAECLGHLILGRKDPASPWSREEQQGAFDVAGDIGQTVLNARNLVREQRLVAELRRMSTYKSELLSTVSHELKNPLGVISGHLELLDGADDLSEESQFSVSAMVRATRRVTRVVDDLLLLSEVEDPDAEVVSRRVELGPLVDDALELVRFAAQQRNLTVQVELPDHPVHGCGDAAELDRVLTNLMSNAVKYTPRDRMITISVADHGREVELAVSDQGIGISADDQQHLFTEFYRSTNPQALAQPGTGLGLAICSRIVARHRGRIEVESELGLGSTFRVILPAPDAGG